MTPQVDRQTQQRALNGHEIGQQLRHIALTIIHDGGTGLADGGRRLVRFPGAQVSPGGQIGSVGHIVNLFHPQVFQPSKEALQFRKMHLCRRSHHHRHGDSFFQVLQKGCRIIRIIPGLMVTGGQTSATGDAIFVIHHDLSGSIVGAIHLIGTIHGTNSNALVAPGTFFFNGEHAFYLR